MPKHPMHEALDAALRPFVGRPLTGETASGMAVRLTELMLERQRIYHLGAAPTFTVTPDPERRSLAVEFDNPRYAERWFSAVAPQFLEFTMSTQQRIAFIDVETTGLDPTEDHLLEVACIVTDLNGDRVEGVEPFDRLVRINPQAWARMFGRAEVVKMHTASGLINDLFSEPGGHERHAVINDLRTYLHLHAQGAYLGGFSCHFDRRVLEGLRHDVLEALSHRHVDVTSLAIVAEHLHGRNIKHVAPLNRTKHRAYNDCLHAIEAYRLGLGVLGVGGVQR